MKLHYEPTVYLAGSQDVERAVETFLEDHGVGNWVSDAKNSADLIPEIAGRLCYMSFGKPRPGGNKTYLQHILESGHGSVLEHVSFNFIFCGISRSLSHELVRHRAGWGYSQLSQRFVDESAAEYVVPYELRQEVKSAVDDITEYCCNQFGKDFNTEQFTNALEYFHSMLNTYVGGTDMGIEWLKSCQDDTTKYKKFSDYLFGKVTKDAYDKWAYEVCDSSNYPKGPSPYAEWFKGVKQEDKTTMRKAARSAARSVLPNATETKVFATANVRAIRHFIEMRGSRFADHEIRMLAYKVWQQVSKFSENLFSDYEWKMDGDFPLDVATKYRKV
jgi:thymidylate synthase (FAD)